MLKPACADAIGTLFVFLHLLECYAQRVAKLGLAQVKHQASHSDPRADVYVS